MTFDGAGKYALSKTQLFGSPGSTGMGSCASLVERNERNSDGSPNWIARYYGCTFSQPVITASSTEDDGFDLFVAVQRAVGFIFERHPLGRLHGWHSGL